MTIPTQLAIAESKRLLSALDTQGVAVRNIIVNQVWMSVLRRFEMCASWNQTISWLGSSTRMHLLVGFPPELVFFFFYPGTKW